MHGLFSRNVNRGPGAELHRWAGACTAGSKLAGHQAQQLAGRSAALAGRLFGGLDRHPHLGLKGPLSSFEVALSARSKGSEEGGVSRRQAGRR